MFCHLQARDLPKPHRGLLGSLGVGPALCSDLKTREFPIMKNHMLTNSEHELKTGGFRDQVPNRCCSGFCIGPGAQASSLDFPQLSYVQKTRRLFIKHGSDHMRVCFVRVERPHTSNLYVISPLPTPT